MSMLSLHALEKKIKETKEQIRNFEALESSLMAQFQLEEMERRLNELSQARESLIKSQSKESISLRAYGDNVQEGRISNRVLISLLNGFQTMIDDISNTMVGTNASRGQLKDYAKEVADFEVCGFFAGSFGISLEKKYHQIEFTNQSFRTNDILQEFFSILENSLNGESLIEKIAPFGQRTVRQYRDWLKQIKDNAINVELDWVNEISERRNIDIHFSEVSDVIYVLDSISDIEEEDVYMSGQLTGVNIRKQTFELKSDTNDIIKGKSRLETLIKISNRIGDEIKVKLIKSTSKSSICGKKETWFLADLDDRTKL